MSAQNPTFADIVTLLNTLYNNDPNIDNAPHGAFWQNTNRDAFVALQTDDWGVSGPLVMLGNHNQSNLYLALAGTGSFAGLQMPFLPSDPNGRYATSTELAMVATWIDGNAPA